MTEYNQDHIMLLVTENCNLNCSYCYERRKNLKNMPYETAVSIIDAHLKDAAPDKPIVIEVFGGEAFANFDLIRKIDAYVERTYGDLKVFYETTTNGTLVHGEIQEWLTKRKEKFLLSVSVDGTRDMHNRNRVFASGKGSFDSIDLDFFVKTWSGCPAKMTISERTLPNMSAGIIYLESLGFKCDATLSVGMEWDYEKNQEIFIRELIKLIEYYIARPEQQLCTMLNLDLREILAPFDENYRFCGAGVTMTCYDADGKRYPCQGFAPVSIGEAAETYVDFNPDHFLLSDDNMCKRCLAARLCPNCYAANLQSDGNIQIVNRDLCSLYKLCILASAKIQYQRIAKKRTYTRDDQLTLKAIGMIQDWLR